MKEIVVTYHAHAKLKTLLSMQCYYRYKLELQIIEDNSEIKTARNTDATAMACNSTLDTLVLRKREKLRYRGKEWSYRPIQNSHTDHAK